MNNRSELLCELQKYDFTLYDLQLYLNSHPNCPDALKKYEKCKKMKEEVLSQYIKQYGPITAIQSDTETSWNWIDNPWPWEKEANY